MTSAEKSDIIWKLEQANRNESKLNDRLRAQVAKLQDADERVRAVVAKLRGLACGGRSMYPFLTPTEKAGAEGIVTGYEQSAALLEAALLAPTPPTTP